MKLPAWLHTGLTLALLAAPGRDVPKEAPPYGLTLGGTITRIVDIDTLDFQPDPVTIRVRLKDTWGVELKDERGREAKDYLVKLAEGKRGVLFIPGHTRASDMFTLNRGLGYVWREGDENSLNYQVVKAGYATYDKPKKPKSK